jgi:uncharacterized protein YneF (UPF0154 family)
VKPRLVSRFDMLPIRWRLAVTSAILTFVILLTFGLVIAFFTERQMENDFNDEVKDNATRIQQRLQEQVETTVSGYRIDARDEVLEFASGDNVVIRVLDANGDIRLETADAPDLGSPRPGLQDVGDYRVASRELTRPFDDVPLAYVQYAKSRSSLATTINRLRVFLALGVLGGGALALLAGLAVARRAMEPISGLTRAARRVAKTRDPGVDLPRLRADDEIADLSHTLDDMLAELAEAHTSCARRSRASWPTSSCSRLTSKARTAKSPAPPSAPRSGCAGWSPTSCSWHAPTPGARRRASLWTWPRSFARRRAKRRHSPSTTSSRSMRANP